MSALTILRRSAGIAALACILLAAAVPGARAVLLAGTSKGERLSGTSAADTIKAGGGRDRVRGLLGDDRIFGGRGNDRIEGGKGADRLGGGPASDTIDGNEGADRIGGGSGRDLLRGHSGPDRIGGDGGGDTAYDGRGDDRLSGGGGRDRLYAGGGVDSLLGGPGGDSLWAGARSDVGKAGADRAVGGSGDDVFHMRDGEPDVVVCGRGRDRALLDGADVIADATPKRPRGSCNVVKRSGPVLELPSGAPVGPLGGPTAPPGGPSATLLAAGDIADCNSPGAEQTARLLDALAGTVAALGDEAYESGTLDEFTRCYHPTWGRHKARTRPVPGDHEYETAGAAGYFNYFGAAAGAPGKGYYSYELGSWHVVALNSNCGAVGGCHAGSAQERWLRADLAAHPSACTLAYWHSPRFSSGPTHGPNAAMEPFWLALYETGAEIVLSGDDHDYERFAPQTASGQLDAARGLRQFVVGTGGRHLYAFGSTFLPNSQTHDNSTWGVIALTLHATSYDWRFVPAGGGTYTDAGGDQCH